MKQLVKERLPFVREGKGSLELWVPERTDDWALDNATGRRYASLLVEVMVETEEPLLLGRVVSAMVSGGHFEAVEVGFLHHLATRLIAPQ